MLKLFHIHRVSETLTGSDESYLPVTLMRENLSGKNCL